MEGFKKGMNTTVYSDIREIKKYALDNKVPIMIMLNFYEGNKIHVFEIWNAKS